METILLYTGEDRPLVWDVSTPDLRDQAYHALFQRLDEQGKFGNLPSDEFQLHNLAKRGNPKVARAFIMVKDLPLSEVQVVRAAEPSARPVVLVNSAEALAEENLPKASNG